jgi:hypothetical protein
MTPSTTLKTNPETRSLRSRLTLAALALLIVAPVTAATPKAGAAKIDITPSGPIWLSGYASRSKPSAGVRAPIHAKALAIEDGSGGRVVIVTIDIIGLPQAMSDRIAASAADKYRLSRDQLLLNSSHTHTGPMIDGNLSPMEPKDPENLARIKAYGLVLHDKVIEVIGAALGNLQPARLSFDFGEAKFAGNRRVKTDKGWANAQNPDGPVDHRVPVLRVSGRNGQILALLFGYACHNTTATGENYDISGDYAGYAQSEIERRLPGSTALFITLCAGDQNPYPRGKYELAEQHGHTLGAEVARVAATPMKPVSGKMKSAFKMTRLALENMQQVDYPVQAVRFQRGFTLIALGGEVVIDYVKILGGMFPKEPLVVSGYSNAVMAYIPSKRILDEGGYEGGDSMKWYSLPTRFAADVEERVKEAAQDVMRRVK